jgi:uncharacterized protein YodC (DUF2158 family)
MNVRRQQIELSNIYPTAAISSELFCDGTPISWLDANHKHMESAMTLTKQATIAIAVVLVTGLSAPPVTTALADPALPDSAIHSDSAFQFHNGDFVRLRTGGPLMTVTSVQGDQVFCAWSEPDGQLLSGRFPLTLLASPITLPSYAE